MERLEHQTAAAHTAMLVSNVLQLLVLEFKTLLLTTIGYDLSPPSEEL